jgi:thioredoxin reductase
LGFADRAPVPGRGDRSGRGGNSAGQSAVFLRSFAKTIWMLVRGPSLAESMSQYLGIRAIDNIEVLTHTEIVALYGSREKQLQRVRWRNNLTSKETEKPVRLVFCFIGAEPATGWLRDSGVALDGKNFILTGSDVPRDTRRSNNGSGRPLPLETSVRNVFASGDVGSGSVERIGAAIGEGCRRRRRTACRAHKRRRGGAARRDQVKRSVTKCARHDFVFDGRQGVDGLAWQSSKAAICAVA